MSNAIELKPCPFCGADAEIVHINEGENAGGSCVCCTSCMASGNVEFEFKENFISNWNRRAALANTQGVKDEALSYAERLARNLADKHYPENTEWKPLDGDLIGILTQIDNMTSGLSRSLPAITLQGEPVGYISEENLSLLNSGKAANHAGISRSGGNVFTVPLYASPTLAHPPVTHSAEPWAWVIPRGKGKKPIILTAALHDESSAAAEADIHDLGYFPVYALSTPPQAVTEGWEKALKALEVYADEKTAIAFSRMMEARRVNDTDFADMMEKERDAYSDMTMRIRDLSTPPQAVTEVTDYFGQLVIRARRSAEKASIKFPQPNYVTLKIAEEAGEVVRGAVHYAENRMEWSEVEDEIVQLMAMLIRFVTEGDEVNGVTPPAIKASLTEGVK